MAGKVGVRSKFTALLVLVLVMSPTVAAAAEDPAERRREVRTQEAQVAARIDALEADAAEVEAALVAVGADVAGQHQAVANAQREVEAAAAEIQYAQAAAAEIAARVGVLESSVRDEAVRAYVAGPSMPLLEVLTGKPEATPGSQVFLSLQARRADDAIDELDAARADLALWEQRAMEAQQRAEIKQGQEVARLVDLAAAEERQRQLASEVEDRLDASLGEAAALEQLDQQLSSEIRRREEELARQLAAEAAARAQREAAAAARARSTPTTTVPSNRSSTPTSRGPSTSSGPLATVRGITVSSTIAGQLERMLGAAERDGIVLGGGGFRDSAGQIATRRANCGTSDYAVYEMPSSACRPPTARPGRSMHEQGLAIDFTHNGSIIGSRGSPAFRWLAANAGSYGLINMPAEPWHWSTNGN